MTKQIVAKLGNMRKAQHWAVHPATATKGDVLIQSETHICQFDPNTGVGVLWAPRPNEAGSSSAMQMPGAILITVPADVIAAALDAQPTSGE